MHICMGMPFDETAISARRTPDADELPPFELPMKQGPNGWIRIEPMIDTTGRNTNWHTESRVNHLEESQGNGFGQWDKTWPTYGQPFFDAADVGQDLEKMRTKLEAEDKKSQSIAPAL